MALPAKKKVELEPDKVTKKTTVEGHSQYKKMITESTPTEKKDELKIKAKEGEEVQDLEMVNEEGGREFQESEKILQ